MRAATVRFGLLLTLAAARLAAVDQLETNDRNELLYRLSNYAWAVATDSTVADGPTATTVAGWMIEVGKLPTYMTDTVAACFARGADFPAAVRWESEALHRAQTSGGSEQTQAEFASRLALYREGKPYVEHGNPPPAQPFRQTWPDGALKAEGLLAKDGNYTGLWRYFFKDGKPMALGTHHEGSQFGLWKRWYESGSLRDEGHYFQGCRIGPWREWHPNGQPLGVGWYLERSPGDTTRCGRWSFWWDNGQKACEGAYTRGQRDGPWTFLDRDGKLTITVTYSYDALKLLRHAQPGEIPSPYEDQAPQGAEDF
jgi:hypothetical protein